MAVGVFQWNGPLVNAHGIDQVPVGSSQLGSFSIVLHSKEKQQA